MRGRAWRAVLLALNAFLLIQVSGCEPQEIVSSAVETHVRADGSAERRVLVDASPPGPTLALSEEWSLQSGVNPEERSAAVSRSYEDLTRGPQESGGMGLEVEDRFFWREYSFTDSSGGLLEGGRRVTGEVGYKLVMPGKISDAPGATRKSGGVAIYEFGGEERLEVRAESWSVRWWAVIGVAAGLLAVAALIVGGRAAGFVKSIGRWLWTGR